VSTHAKFWLVWCVSGGAPTVQHATEEAAEREAERLARAHPGSTFVTLGSLHSFRRSDVERIKHEAEMPF
jgi:hypothetical protein